MSLDHTLTHGVKHAYEHVQLFGDGVTAHELSDIVKQHALLGFASGFIPIPGADLAAMTANIWTMYIRINKAVGISFGENVLKSIVSGVIANLLSIIPGVALAIGVETALKFIPGIGTIGGIAVGAAVNVALMYVAGRVYLKSIEILINDNEPLTANNIKRASVRASKDKAFVKNAYTEGKNIAKNHR